MRPELASPRPLRELAGRVLAELDREDPELEGVKRIIRDGNGADRQRAAHERGGMRGLLRYLADVTRGLTPEGSDPKPR